MITAPAVEVGQVWADNDKRLKEDYRERSVRVLELVESTDPFGHAKIRKARVVDIDTGRVSLIRVDRFRPTATGYRFVSGPAVEVEA